MRASTAIDSSARRLYVSHATQVEVLDADSGKLIGTIADTPGVHGAAIASAFKHGFTSNGRENKVSMFDPTTLALAWPAASSASPKINASLIGSRRLAVRTAA